PSRQLPARGDRSRGSRGARSCPRAGGGGRGGATGTGQAAAWRARSHRTLPRAGARPPRRGRDRRRPPRRRRRHRAPRTARALAPAGLPRPPVPRSRSRRGSSVARPGRRRGTSRDRAG
ncbi:MAG: hypothetical protein E6G37_11395, partial [Actinobacteria bacterium]